METLFCFRDPLLSSLSDRHFFLPLVHLVSSEKESHFYIQDWTAVWGFLVCFLFCVCVFVFIFKIPPVYFNVCFCVTWLVPNT